MLGDMKPERPLDPSNRVMAPQAAEALRPEPPHTGVPATAGDADAQERDRIARARGGDRAAFAWLVDRHRDRAYALALRIVRTPAEAEEVAQDAFVRVWRALPGFRGDAAFATWLHRIVARRAFDRLAVLRNRRAREAPLDGVPEPVQTGTHEDDLEHRECHARLERLMATLTDAQRAVVTLYYLADRSVEEVAGSLGMPVNTVKTHLSRARAALRERWDEEGRA